MKYIIDGSFLYGHIKGVQRYARQITKELDKYMADKPYEVEIAVPEIDSEGTSAEINSYKTHYNNIKIVILAGKSGRSINNVPESPVKKMIFSWEGILVLLFIAVNIFCAMFSEYYNLSSLLRQMPVYLAEVFMMLPMAYILVLGEIDISVGAYCLPF